MKTKPLAILLMVITTLCTSLAQVLYKFAAPNLQLNLIALITNIPLIAGLILYGLAAIFLILALRLGEVSVLYPIVATSYIWVTLLAMLLFNESINLLRWTGVIVIILGVILISVDKKTEAMPV